MALPKVTVADALVLAGELATRSNKDILAIAERLKHENPKIYEFVNNMIILTGFSETSHLIMHTIVDVIRLLEIADERERKAKIASMN